MPTVHNQMVTVLKHSLYLTIESQLNLLRCEKIFDEKYGVHESSEIRLNGKRPKSMTSSKDNWNLKASNTSRT